MKYLIVSILLLCFAIMAEAQQRPIYTFKQKQLTDSLRMLFPDLYTQKENDSNTPDFTTPVLPLPNEGTSVAITEKGEIYKMKPDNMPSLKPNETDLAMPNAMNGKLKVVPKNKKP